MKIFVAIDDSRQLDGAKAGETASILSKFIEDNGWGKCAIPSRQRLYSHPDTGCKKHNTARSFSADIGEQYLADFVDHACNLIKRTGTPECNAGLAVAVPELMGNIGELMSGPIRALLSRQLR